MKDKELKRLKKLLREQQLEEDKLNGRPRSNTWGGKPDSQKQRRQSKREINKFINDKKYQED